MWLRLTGWLILRPNHWLIWRSAFLVGLKQFVFPFILEGQSLLSVTVAYICLSVWICDFSLYYLTSWKHINNSAVKLLILLMFVLLFRFQKWSLLGGSSCHKKTCFCYLKGFHKRLKVVLMKMYELIPNQSNIPNILDKDK